jgi:hypothetical protein
MSYEEEDTCMSYEALHDVTDPSALVHGFGKRRTCLDYLRKAHLYWSCLVQLTTTPNPKPYMPCLSPQGSPVCVSATH